MLCNAMYKTFRFCMEMLRNVKLSTEWWSFAHFWPMFAFGDSLAGIGRNCHRIWPWRTCITNCCSTGMAQIVCKRTLHNQKIWSRMCCFTTKIPLPCFLGCCPTRILKTIFVFILRRQGFYMQIQIFAILNRNEKNWPNLSGSLLFCTELSESRFGTCHWMV